MTEKKTVFFTMVHHPINGKMRAGRAYSTRSRALEWAPFVSSAWRGLRVTVNACTLTYQDGKLTEKSLKVLSEKFNMDGPKEGVMAK